jgi:hypothetical protein
LKERSHTFITLHYPFVKLKNRINNLAFRWFLAVIQDERIIPLIMFTKKDEWENLNWKNYKLEIEFEYAKNRDDILNKKFREY